MSGSKVTAIVLNGGILPSGEVASGRVCTCGLRSRLVDNAKEYGLVRTCKVS